MNYAIMVEALSHKFAQKQVLDQVTFQVARGEVFGLIGPSGAGKTTLVKILTGQLRRKEGYSELLGRDTNCLAAAQLLKIGAMMDNFGLYERLSVIQNMYFYADIYRVPRQGIAGILKSIGLYGARNQPVAKLSKGMKSRLSLARALMNDAEALFLDEPTSGLDPSTTREIHNVLREQKKRGATIFLTTHNMHEAQSLCSQVALLSQGRIIESGHPREVCKKYDDRNKLLVALKDGRLVELEHGSAAARPLQEYLEKGMVASIHSTEPTLESVFIELTGKGLG